MRLPDHDDLGPDAMSSLRALADAHRDAFDLLLCTHKDLVKIQTDQIAGKPLMAVGIELTLLGDAAPLYERLRGLINQDESDRQSDRLR
jgi:tetraacyldisaccharide 4'-kinase